VDAAEGFGIDVPDRTDDDVGLQFGFHEADSTLGSAGGEIGAAA
jgi:hypothetical protein